MSLSHRGTRAYRTPSRLSWLSLQSSSQIGHCKKEKKNEGLEIHPKGQLISKCHFGVFTFFQKTNENKSTSSKVEFVRSFFGRNIGLKKSFRICLTFSWAVSMAIGMLNRVCSRSEFQVCHSNQSTIDQKYTLIFFLPLTKIRNRTGTFLEN